MPGKFVIDGGLSSQFVSALLIVCPRLHGNSQVLLQGKKIVSETYVTMTLQVLSTAGVRVRKMGPRKYQVQGNQKFRGLKDFTVPSDYGLAAFLMAAAILTRSQVILKGLWKDNLVQENQKFRGLKDFTVPSDYGLAAFLMAAAILTRSQVILKGLWKDNLVQ